MPQPEKKDMWFKSADGKNQGYAEMYTPKEAPPWCVVQIAHGMCEYIGRYKEFAQFLAAQGVAVCGNDHLGHGATAAKPEDYGYFGEKGARKHVLQDMKTMNDLAHQQFPGLPVVLLGHSMGSFYARKYTTMWPNSIAGLIVSGTAGKNPMAGMGIALTGLMTAIKGGRHKSNMVHVMAFGQYLKGIENPKSPYDWISRDEEIVAAYAADPKCTFHFTVNGFHEMLKIMKEVSSPQWATGIPKDMPVLFISGDGDPVGDYGKGVRQVQAWMHNAGVKNIKMEIYPGGRHEMLNETNRQEVYEDVLDFLRQWWGKQQ